MPPPAAAPTVRSLALALGLSRTTVSDALAGSPRVDPGTAQRVREAAQAAGYVRNPLAGALMSELRRSRGSTFRGVLAAIDLDEEGRPPFAAKYNHELQLGAAERAAELGFKVELFGVGQGGVSIHRLDSILHSRSIHGLIFLPSWRDPDFSKLDWMRYAGVYTDYIIERPALHSICCGHYRAMMSVLQRLTALGYRRPGLFLDRLHDERLQHRWEAAFLAYGHRNPAVTPVPTHVVDPVNREGFVRWFRQYKPDVVLGHHTEAIGWMEDCGAKLPATHGFVCLNVLRKTRPCAGLDLQPRILGARGAEIVIAQLQRNEIGVPVWPTTTTFPARWVDGPTLRRPPQKSAKANAAAMAPA